MKQYLLVTLILSMILISGCQNQNQDPYIITFQQCGCQVSELAEDNVTQICTSYQQDEGWSYPPKTCKMWDNTGYIIEGERYVKDEN